MGVFENKELEPEVVKNIARELVVDEADVVEMNRRLGGDKSLNVSVSDDDESEQIDFLVDGSQNVEESLARRQEAGYKMQILQKCLSQLSEREQYIIKNRMLTDKPETLENIGQKFNISRERIRQIEKTSFDKLKALVLVAISAKR